MNSRERVLAALERRTPDRVPTFEVVIDSQVMNAIVPGAGACDFVDAMGLDAIAVRPDIKREQIEENVFRDERGQIVQKTTQDYLEPVNIVIKDEKDLRQFDFPDPNAPHRLESLKKAIDRFKGRVPVIAFLREGWSEARDLHGFSESLVDLHDNPGLIRGIVEKAVDYYSELGRLAAELGAEIAFSGDDFAGNNGLFMSPQHFRDIIYPAMSGILPIDVTKENSCQNLIKILYWRRKPNWTQRLWTVKRWRIMRVMNLGNHKVLTTMFLPLKSVP